MQNVYLAVQNFLLKQKCVGTEICCCVLEWKLNVGNNFVRHNIKKILTDKIRPSDGNL